jgi:prolyl 4-hydroxylase
LGTTEGEVLQRRAESGDPDAQMTLASLLDKRGMHEHALNWLRTAAENGVAEAHHILGARLLVGRAAPYNPNEAIRHVSAAASHDLPEALVLMSVMATLAGEWDQAVMFMNRAAAHGDSRAQRQVELLGNPQSFNTSQWDAPVIPEAQFETPHVAVVRNFIPRTFCEYIIDRAKPKLESVRVKDPNSGGGREVDYRTNSGAGFSILDTDLILQMVNGRVSDLVDLSIGNQEPTNVLHYKRGEEYKAHFDFITPSPQNAAELAATGQRMATVLIYLNDDYEGGETEFPNLKWKFKGRTGDALMFRNINAQGEPDRQTLHAGLPVKKGEKWLYSKWIRANPYPLI